MTTTAPLRGTQALGFFQERLATALLHLGSLFLMVPSLLARAFAEADHRRSLSHLAAAGIRDHDEVKWACWRARFRHCGAGHNRHSRPATSQILL